MELKGLEAPDELQINTVMQQATQQNPEKLKPTCHHCKAPGQYGNQCRQLKGRKIKTKTRRIVLTMKIIRIMVKQALTPTTNILTKPTQTIQIIKKTQELDLSAHTVRPVVYLSNPQRNGTLEQTQRTDRLLGTDDLKVEIKSDREMPKAT